MKQDIAKRPGLLGKTVFSRISEADSARRTTRTAFLVGGQRPCLFGIIGRKPWVFQGGKKNRIKQSVTSRCALDTFIPY